MREKTTYVSDDGMEFSAESDCLNWENSRRDWGSVAFYTDCLERLSTQWSDLENLYDHTEYLHIIDANRAEKVLDWLEEEMGFVPPEEYETGDVFGWDSDWQDWYNIREKIADLTNTLMKLTGIAEGGGETCE